METPPATSAPVKAKRASKKEKKVASPAPVAEPEGVPKLVPAKRARKVEKSSNRVNFGKSDRNIGKVHLSFHRKASKEAWEALHPGEKFKCPRKGDPVWTKSKEIFAEKYKDEVTKEVEKIKSDPHFGKGTFIERSAMQVKESFLNPTAGIPSEVPGGVSLVAQA